MGTKLATASADRMVRIFEVNTNSGSHQLTDELKGHQGPVNNLIIILELRILNGTVEFFLI